MSAPSIASRKSFQPCWGWSGPSKLPQHDQIFDEVVLLLPSKKSSSHEIAAQLNALGARLHGWLHQDEFGPSRGAQSAALRTHISSVKTLCRLLQRTPPCFRHRLDFAIRNRADGVHSCLEALEGAAADVGFDAQDNWANRDNIAWLSRMRNCATAVVLEVDALDDSTDGEIILTAEAHGFELSQAAPGQLDFAQMERWLNRYWTILSETFNSLSDRRGRPEGVSLKLVVAELCKLYEYETETPVTAHAMKGVDFTGRVETDAGRFVTAAVEAMLPDQSWFERRAVQSKRAESFLPGREKIRAVQIIAIMRDFVARRRTGAPERLAAHRHAY
jgi:hypothetical protein